ncbi:uncharacterized protein LOC132048904 [Lycium ferocissimum]|uniref:uncharacterized protein LOC132048904 n=1 Tax=Lycium ferocissimum TaxID=112874 RepID=UPI0028163EB7|nr:uncharacterized protein LOC132048904 [Lycium ferocissimum]
MDFVVGLLKTLGKFDLVRVIVDRLTKSAHFIPVQITYTSQNIAFHPQTEGQSERTIQALKDMLRACVIDFGYHWDPFLALAEFVYNNSYHSSIDRALSEVLYGRRCRSSIGRLDAFEVRPWGTDFLRESLDKVKNLSYEEEPIAILYREVCKLRSKEIVSVKVQWKNRLIEEATWETESDMCNNYPQLFTESGTFPFVSFLLPVQGRTVV